MERAHGELRARLADRLRSDNSDRLAKVHQMPAAQVAAVALDAHALTRLAGEHRADLDPLDAAVLDPTHLVLIDHLVGTYQHLARERIAHIFERDPPEHAVAERLDDLAAFDEWCHVDSVERATVILGDDRVLRHVDESAREITGVRGLERGV